MLVVQETEDEDDEIKFFTAVALRGVDSHLRCTSQQLHLLDKVENGTCQSLCSDRRRWSQTALRGFSSCSSSTCCHRFHSAGRAEKQVQFLHEVVGTPVVVKETTAKQKQVLLRHPST